MLGSDSSSQNCLLIGKSVHFKWNVNTRWCLYCRGLLKCVFQAKPELQKHSLIWLYMRKLSLHCGNIYIIYSLGSTKNNDFCHNSDCLQVSVSLGVLPFTFESASEDLKCYASWFINKLCFRVILGSFCVAKKRYSSCTPLWCMLACHFHSSLCVCFWSFMEAGYLS